MSDWKNVASLWIPRDKDTGEVVERKYRLKGLLEDGTEVLLFKNEKKEGGSPNQADYRLIAPPPKDDGPSESANDTDDVPF